MNGGIYKEEKCPSCGGVLKDTGKALVCSLHTNIKACAHIGIEGVDLYGGTRHSSVRALIAEQYAPEQVKQAAMSETNNAFERYMGKAIDQDLRAIYKKSAMVIDFTKGLPLPDSDQ